MLHRQILENMHPVEDDGCNLEGAPLGDQSTDERYVTTIFWVSWVANTEGSEAGL